MIGGIKMRHYKTIDIWKNVDIEEWNDWKWQVKNRIVSAEQLSKVIDISGKEQQEINACLKKFRMAITPYYSTLIDPDDINCPVRIQSIPSAKELIIQENEFYFFLLINVLCIADIVQEGEWLEKKTFQLVKKLWIKLLNTSGIIKL